MCPSASETPRMDGSEYNTVAALIEDQNTGEPRRAHVNQDTFSGNYLSSRFAQRHHDWGKATGFVNGVLKHAPDDLALKKRAMVLGMGAGQTELAIQSARDVLAEEPDNALALLFVAMADFKAKDYEAANAIILGMPNGSLSAFIMPLLNSWSQASLGVNDTEALRSNALHLYHAIFIADYLEQNETVKALLERSEKSGDITTNELVQIAGIYAHIGEQEKAQEIFEKVLMVEPNNRAATRGAEALTQKNQTQIFDVIQSPEDGLSLAMYDMARVLYGDYSDESARIFAHLAVYLNPSNVDATMLLGHIATRNERYSDAVVFYKSVPEGDAQYFDARRLAADLLEEQGDVDGALAALNTLADQYGDLDALIQIGDIYRRNDDFSKAVTSYNKAVKELGGVIPPDYWQIHYVRGMSYEQMGEWEKAESDLLAALKFQPDHPFVLNYLGYSWADQGIKLEQSRDMIQKAVNIRPQDGYITDSLGWVLYRMGDYQGAIAPLERAVELLPYDPTINDHLGDAYWKVGRRLEARFQWERAKNHSKSDEDMQVISDKIEYGLDQPKPVAKEAQAKQASE